MTENEGKSRLLIFFEEKAYIINRDSKNGELNESEEV